MATAGVLLACGAKKYETRNWAPKYRGPIAIHAAVKPTLSWFQRDVEKEARRIVIKALSKNKQGLLQHLPLGAVIATAELVECHKMTEERGRIHIYVGAKELPGSKAPDFYHPTKQEKLFGDWRLCRFAWEFANMTMLPEPVPTKGRQGLWT
jgi:hypothetical protein